MTKRSWRSLDKAMCLGNRLLYAWRQRKKPEAVSYSSDVIYPQAPNSSHIFKHITEELQLFILFFQLATGWNHCISHCIPQLIFSHWIQACPSKNSSFLSHVLKLQRPSLSSKWWQVSLPRKLPHKHNLDILGTDGVLAGLGSTSGLLLWWTKRLSVSSWLTAVLISRAARPETLPMDWKEVLSLPT